MMATSVSAGLVWGSRSGTYALLVLIQGPGSTMGRTRSGISAATAAIGTGLTGGLTERDATDPIGAREARATSAAIWRPQIRLWQRPMPARVEVRTP